MPSPTRVTRCRACQSPDLDTILSLGEMPLANGFLAHAQLAHPEPRYPLNLAFCPACSLVQLTETVPPETLFVEYPYFSSYAHSTVDSARKLVSRMIREHDLHRDSLVIELGSNDGYLLQHYVREAIRALGIDPARNVVPAAEAKGVPTLCDFFGPDLGERLGASGTLADVVHANNVLAHVPDPNGFVSGIARILAPGGTAVIETPYARNLIEQAQFDTIYHEHASYFSVTSLDRLLRANGLMLLDVEEIPAHGGSLRAFAGREEARPRPPSVAMHLEREERLGMTTPDFYSGFAGGVESLCGRLRDVVHELRRNGRRIVGYGAAAKGTMLLNKCGFGADTLDFVVDHTPAKQNRFVPGVRLPIYSPDRLLESMPDYVLVLAWNHLDEILVTEADFRRRGGRFLVPIPEPKVV